MTRILRMDERLRNLSLPEMEKIDDLSISAGDVLITCAGFEDRSIHILKSLIAAGRKDFFVIFVEYKPYVAANRTSEIQQLCQSHKIEFTSIIYDRQNPVNGGESCLSVLPYSRNNLWIDISGMSRLLVVQIIVALSRRDDAFKHSCILYAEAQEYPPNEQAVKDAINRKSAGSDDLLMFLSSGVFDVSIVPELSSVAQLGQPVRLIVFPSFNPHQLIALRSVLQPSYITFVNGLPPASENKWRTEAIRLINNIETMRNKEESVTSTLDYRETVHYLLDEYSRHGDMEKLVIAPIGSKMQSVAVGLTRSYLDDLQIAYPTPRNFTKPTEYTKGVKQLYQLCLAKFPAKDSL